MPVHPLYAPAPSTQHSREPAIGFKMGGGAPLLFAPSGFIVFNTPKGRLSPRHVDLVNAHYHSKNSTPQRQRTNLLLFLRLDNLS
jgi:hypothetical protein